MIQINQQVFLLSEDMDMEWMGSYIVSHLKDSYLMEEK